MKFVVKTFSFACILTSAFLLGHSCSARGIDYDALHRFSQIIDLVDQYYVEEVSHEELIEGSIKGMLESLDPHSTYMTAEEFSMMQETTAGEFFGIGAELTIENGRPIVIAPIEDTPAFKAGIKAGDIIISVDGILTLDKSLTETVSKIRGKKGTAVELVVLSQNANAPKTIKIVRDAIPHISVKHKELEPGYHWLRLAFFNDKTTDELKKIIKDMKKSGEIKGIILDMRNNPGGLLDQAASVADLFLDRGTIVSIRGRNNKLENQFNASKNSNDLLNIPLITLINPGSASASEIVAGALSDNKRAILMGERSFGKGSVQNLIPLRDGAGVKITIALYYTPNGKSIQAEGIEPNIEVPFSPKSEELKPALVVRENDLDRRLDQGHIDTEKTNRVLERYEEKMGVPSTQEAEKKDDIQKFPAPELTPLGNMPAEIKALLEEDNQLRTALQVVKNMPTLK